ncbi:MAG: N-acetylmuramoyl-L-alanine amidase [Lachnospiraceae bacterium]
MKTKHRKTISQADKEERMLGLCTLILTALIVLNVKNDLVKAGTTAATKKAGYTIVVDSGHGGQDPGKIGVDGQVEKDLNLAIATSLQEKLVEHNVHVIMTRTEDVTATGEVNSSKGEDMNARIRMINDENVDLCVSIHQNSYTSSDIHGAQAFYYTASEEGKALANSIQNRLVSDVDPENTRVEKADSSYYILVHSSCPTVIVECGFLSNPEEAKKLSDKEYQEKTATAICDGILDYFSR